MQSSFSVSKRRLAELKKRLAELALEFVDEVREPEGDTVVRLALALLPIMRQGQAPKKFS